MFMLCGSVYQTTDTAVQKKEAFCPSTSSHSDVRTCLLRLQCAPDTNSGRSNSFRQLLREIYCCSLLIASALSLKLTSASGAKLPAALFLQNLLDDAPADSSQSLLTFGTCKNDEKLCFT